MALLASFTLGGTAVAAQEGSFALQGARVLTAAGPPLEEATILVRDGKIAAVGRGIDVPADVPVLDVTGMDVIPGMMDNHSHIGFPIQDANERGTPFTPHYRILDILSPDDEYWEEAAAGGVTTVVTGPGSGSVSSGQAAVVKTFGADLSGRILQERGGIKIAAGRKAPDRPPSTSMAVTAFLRSQFIQAREYLERWERWEDGGRDGPPPARDLALEAVADALRGEDRIRAHVHSAHDILALLRLQDEFGFHLTLHHATEAYKVADEIARRSVPVVGLPLFLRLSFSDEVMASPVTLTRAGVEFAFHTDDPVLHSRWQRSNGALAIRYGLSEEEALQALTLNAARIARVDDRVGSIEVGKDADLVLVDGPWWELTSRVQRVWVDGRIAYDRLDNEGGAR